MKNSFILKTKIKDLKVCDQLINLFDNNSHLHEEGSMGISLDVDPKKKKCKEIHFYPSSLEMSDYLENLQIICNEYITKFPYSNYYNPWGIVEGIKIKKYSPEEAYFAWHCERDTNAAPVSSRHLVFMTYLNDVKLGGETEFYHQNVKIKPKKGLTLIWPADWTHTHRGLPSPTETKYIISGWFGFVK